MPFKGTLGGVAFVLVVSLMMGCGSKGVPSGKDPARVQTSSGWKVTLKFAVSEPQADGGMVYHRLVAGADPEASDAFDNASDVRALSRGPLRAYFNHTGEVGYGMSDGALWQDIRAAALPARWDIEVEVNGNGPEGKPVLVEWNLPEGEVSCSTHEFLLKDTDGLLQTVDLCKSNGLSYQSSAEAKRFVLRIS